MAALVAEYEAAFERRRLRPGGRTQTYVMLGISGGGEDGAFGAGLLNGWSQHGTRPVFDLVTGVSTGALTAAFAFAGSAWDDVLRQVYTDLTPSDVFLPRSILAALNNDALADNTPLLGTIRRTIDDRLVAAIAEGYREGRLLMVGTANLDAQVPVTWNIGAIAASGHPRARQLIHRILLASAALPGTFPPVMLDVVADGRPFQEMHVDGGIFTQVFLYPRRLTEGRRGGLGRHRDLPARAYIIRNGRLNAAWEQVGRSTLTIAQRAISTMVSSGGYNDVVRIWDTAQRDGVDFNLASIGAGFTTPFTERFEATYMRSLYDYGFARARHGFDWAKRPPG
jgi:hypothetical protein